MENSIKDIIAKKVEASVHTAKEERLRVEMLHLRKEEQYLEQQINENEKLISFLNEHTATLEDMFNVRSDTLSVTTNALPYLEKLHIIKDAHLKETMEKSDDYFAKLKEELEIWQMQDEERIPELRQLRVEERELIRKKSELLRTNEEVQKSETRNKDFAGSNWAEQKALIIKLAQNYHKYVKLQEVKKLEEQCEEQEAKIAQLRKSLGRREREQPFVMPEELKCQIDLLNFAKLSKCESLLELSQDFTLLTPRDSQCNSVASIISLQNNLADINTNNNNGTHIAECRDDNNLSSEGTYLISKAGHNAFGHEKDDKSVESVQPKQIEEPAFVKVPLKIAQEPISVKVPLKTAPVLKRPLSSTIGSNNSKTSNKPQLVNKLQRLRQEKRISAPKILMVSNNMQNNNNNKIVPESPSNKTLFKMPEALHSAHYDNFKNFKQQTRHNFSLDLSSQATLSQHSDHQHDMLLENDKFDENNLFSPEMDISTTTERRSDEPFMFGDSEPFFKM